MTKLEKMKKMAELKRVEAAKFEMELKIEERLDEIERLRWNMENQQKRIDELQAEIDKPEETV